MPCYKVTKPGFYNDKLYDPDGKRSKLIVDKPFDECPTWLAPIQDESTDQRKVREKKEESAKKAQAKKIKEDKQAIDAVTFTQPPATAQVQTL